MSARPPAPPTARGCDRGTLAIANHLADRILIAEQPPRETLVDDGHARRVGRGLLDLAELATPNHRQVERPKIISANEAECRARVRWQIRPWRPADPFDG